MGACASKAVQTSVVSQTDLDAKKEPPHASKRDDAAQPKPTSPNGSPRRDRRTTVAVTFQEKVRRGHVKDVLHQLLAASPEERLYLMNGSAPSVQSLLHLAAESGHVRVLQALFDTLPSLAGEDLALQEAVQQQCMCGLHWPLLKDAVDGDGRTALMIAGEQERRNDASDRTGLISAFLVSKGANPWVARPRDGGRTVLHDAAEHNDARLIDTVLTLCLPHYQTQGIAIKRLVDVPDACGFTPLHYAVAAQGEAAVRALLAQGADPAVRGGRDGVKDTGEGTDGRPPFGSKLQAGFTSLHVAAALCSQPIVNSILQYYGMLREAWKSNRLRADFVPVDPRTVRDASDRRPCDLPEIVGHEDLQEELQPDAMILQDLDAALVVPPCLADGGGNNSDAQQLPPPSPSSSFSSLADHSPVEDSAGARTSPTRARRGARTSFPSDPHVTHTTTLTKFASFAPHGTRSASPPEGNHHGRLMTSASLSHSPSFAPLLGGPFDANGNNGPAFHRRATPPLSSSGASCAATLGGVEGHAKALGYVWTAEEDDRDSVAFRRLVREGAVAEAVHLLKTAPTPLRQRAYLLGCAPYRQSCLHLAAVEGQLGMMQAVLEAVSTGAVGAGDELLAWEVLREQRDPNGHTPLMVAFAKRDTKAHPKIAEFLLAQGANPRAAELDSGATVLHHAAERDDVKAIHLVLDMFGDTSIGAFDRQSGGRLVDVPDIRGFTPLHYAAAYQNEAAAAALLAYGADPAAAGSHAPVGADGGLLYEGIDSPITALQAGATPLHVAVAAGCRPMVQRMMHQYGLERDASKASRHVPIDPRCLRDSQGRRPCDLPAALRNDELHRVVSPDTGVAVDLRPRATNGTATAATVASPRLPLDVEVSSLSAEDVMKEQQLALAAAAAAAAAVAGRTPAASQGKPSFKSDSLPAMSLRAPPNGFTGDAPTRWARNSGQPAVQSPGQRKQYDISPSSSTGSMGGGGGSNGKVPSFARRAMSLGGNEHFRGAAVGSGRLAPSPRGSDGPMSLSQLHKIDEAFAAADGGGFMQPQWGDGGGSMSPQSSSAAALSLSHQTIQQQQPTSHRPRSGRRLAPAGLSGHLTDADEEAAAAAAARQPQIQLLVPPNPRTSSSRYVSSSSSGIERAQVGRYSSSGGGYGGFNAGGGSGGSMRRDGSRRYASDTGGGLEDEQPAVAPLPHPRRALARSAISLLGSAAADAALAAADGPGGSGRSGWMDELPTAPAPAPLTRSGNGRPRVSTAW